MGKERALIKDMKVLLECTDMGSLQRNTDVLIGRAIELLAQPEQNPLSEDEIDKAYQQSCRNYYDLAFKDGVRFAEQYYRIGDRDA